MSDLKITETYKTDETLELNVRLNIRNTLQNLVNNHLHI